MIKLSRKELTRSDLDQIAIPLGTSGSTLLVDPGSSAHHFDFVVSDTGTLSTNDIYVNDEGYITYFLASYSSGQIIGPGTVGTHVTNGGDWDTILYNDIALGVWASSHDGYLGFVTADDLYGWISYSFTRNEGVSTLALHDGAYNSTPGVGIMAGAVVPEPAAIALLVGAGAGVSAFRRRPAHTKAVGPDGMRR